MNEAMRDQAVSEPAQTVRDPGSDGTSESLSDVERARLKKDPKYVDRKVGPVINKFRETDPFPF
jgi:hypothetical protein